MRTALVLTTLLLLTAPAWADVTAHSAESRSFPGGHLVIVDNINGSIESTSYSGADVQVDVAREIEAESPERLEAAKREVKLDMTQSGDTVKLYVDGPFRCHCGDGSSAIHSHHDGYTVRYNFKLRVPASARLDLHTVNRGDIVVHGVGDFDLHNVNGRIEVTDATGTGSAHTVNGEIKATFARNPAARKQLRNRQRPRGYYLPPRLRGRRPPEHHARRHVHRFRGEPNCPPSPEKPANRTAAMCFAAEEPPGCASEPAGPRSKSRL